MWKVSEVIPAYIIGFELNIAIRYTFVFRLSMQNGKWITY